MQLSRRLVTNSWVSASPRLPSNQTPFQSCCFCSLLSFSIQTLPVPFAEGRWALRACSGYEGVPIRPLFLALFNSMAFNSSQVVLTASWNRSDCTWCMGLLWGRTRITHTDFSFSGLWWEFCGEWTIPWVDLLGPVATVASILEVVAPLPNLGGGSAARAGWNQGHGLPRVPRQHGQLWPWLWGTALVLLEVELKEIRWRGWCSWWKKPHTRKQQLQDRSPDPLLPGCGTTDDCSPPASQSLQLSWALSHWLQGIDATGVIQTQIGGRGGEARGRL